MEPKDLETLKEELIEKGVSKEYADKFARFIDYLENFEDYKRKRITITMAVPVYELLKELVKDIVDADGNPYPVSYFIEDAVVWVLKDPERYQQFLDDTYPEEDEDEEGTEKESSEE